MRNPRLDSIKFDVEKELGTAFKKFKPFNSPHEGYAVILEELDELWDEVKTNPQNMDLVRAEAIQVAAMAIRFIYDLC